MHQFEKINAIEFLNGGAFQFLRSQPFEIEYMDMARTLIQVRFTYENNKRISIIGDGKKSYQKGDRLYLDMIEQTISYLKSDKLT